VYITSGLGAEIFTYHQERGEGVRVRARMIVAKRKGIK
jgi:hypothetical protein